ncbi:MAG: YdcH family protein, partial [Desulfobaccales bacterium]
AKGHCPLAPSPKSYLQQSHHYETLKSWPSRCGMEERDLVLIRTYMPQDPELKQLFEEHEDFERRLEEFNRRPYLTAEETLERKRLQKLKLAGRDKIEQILAKYRDKENMS